MKRILAVAVLLVALSTPSGCGGSSGTAPDGPPKDAPRARIVPPETLFQAQPDLSDAEAEALWATPGKVRAVLSILVGRDGVASNAKIVATEPKDQPISQAFAEAVIRSLPLWKFRPATQDGVPVDAEMSLVMEAVGGQGDQPQR